LLSEIIVPYDHRHPVLLSELYCAKYKAREKKMEVGEGGE